ncbi:MAG: hypothetical protein IJZ54_01165 [Clostridia bacterium]|nr:hypothetical protein [Clostridia bacterium]
MKKLFAAFALMILVLSATACSSENIEPLTETTPQTTVATQPTTEQKILEHLELKTEELPLDSRWYGDDLEKAGLERTSTQVRAQGFITEKSKTDKDIRSIILLCDFERYGNAIFHDLFLAVEADTKVIFKDLTFNTIPGAYSEELYLNDIDGDGADEIILHQCVGMSGGAGQYLARIFKVESDEIKEIFCSETKGDSTKRWDTGFSGHPEDNFTFVITNSFTGYKSEYNVGTDRPDRHDENGKAISKRNIMVDSFNVFLPKDIDSDGICEIYCKQYTSDWGHADYTGDAISILKFNTEKQDFEVIDAWFEPADDLK